MSEMVEFSFIGSLFIGLLGSVLLLLLLAIGSFFAGYLCASGADDDSLELPKFCRKKAAKNRKIRIKARVKK